MKFNTAIALICLLLFAIISCKKDVPINPNAQLINESLISNEEGLRTNSLLPITGTKSKLSIHAGWGAGTIQFIQEAKPRIIKILDRVDHENIAKIKEWSPKTLVIGRLYSPDQPLDGDPKKRAQEWWQRSKDKIMASPLVDYWEGYNEIGIGSHDQMRWFAEFEAERTRILSQNSRKSCVGNFSTGVPELEYWPDFFPAIDEALKYSGILGLHEYGTPMQQWFDYNTNEGWLCGRYRKVYKQQLIPANRKIPLAITENGVDYGGEGTPIGNQGDGWKSKYTAIQYLSQLDWYDKMIMEDDYVLGTTIFTIDIPGWNSFDIYPVLNDIITRVKDGTIEYGGGQGTTPMADVIIQKIWTVPSVPKPGESVQVWATVKNVGNAITDDKVGVGFKVNGVQNNGWWHTEPAMEAGASKDFLMDVTYSVGLNESAINIEAIVDDVNRFPEINESNNSLSYTAMVIKPSGSYKGGNLNIEKFRIEAEDYDTGGEAIAYHDLTASNDGKQYRSDGVDVEICKDGGYDVGWIDNTEWMKYSDIKGNGGTYTIKARVASNTPTNQFYIELNGQNVSGIVTFSSTGGWQTWKTINIGTMVLPQGNNIIKVIAKSTGFNIDYFDFESGQNSGTSYKGGNTDINVFRVEAEDYDTDGQGNAYYDKTPENSGKAYRSDAVDVEVCKDGGFDVGWIDQGEWLNFSDIKGNDGSYKVTVRVASNTPENRFHIELNGKQVTQTILFNGTGGWQIWKTLDVGNITIPTGKNTLRIVAETTGFNIDYIDFK